MNQATKRTVDGESERHVKRKISEKEEEETWKDQRDKEELEQKMRERDAVKTRKLTEPNQILRKSNAEQHNDDIQTLRKVSRQDYLKKREEKKLQELKDEIEDEQYLFEGVKLSDAEYRELTHKKEICQLLVTTQSESVNNNEYRMPEVYDDQHGGGVNQEKVFCGYAALQ